MNYLLHLVGFAVGFWLGWMVNPAQRRLKNIWKYKDSL
jgi:membrane associated rhomboid family serine protease